MTKEELERQKWNDIFLEDCAVYDKKIAEEYITLEEQIAKLKEENKELKEVHESDKRSLALIAKKGADLEKKISILLSCKNCPNNKGGYICQKEYEDKCLAQKIQYIKELQEENAELELKIKKLTQHLELQSMSALFEQMKEKVKQEQKIKELEEENTKLKEENNYLSEQIQELKIELDTPESVVLDKLDEAKEIIKLLLGDLRNRSYEHVKDLERAEQFLKEE